MRVLFLTHRLPYAPNRGDRIRSYHVLRFLQKHADVTVLSLAHDRAEADRAADLAADRVDVAIARVSKTWSVACGAIALATRRPFTHALLDAPSMRREIAHAMERSRPDVVLTYCSGMARFALDPPLTGLPFVLDMVDVDSEKWKLLGATARGARRWVYRREARLLAAFEARAVRRAAATIVINEREADAVRQLVPGAEPCVIRNGVDLVSFAPQQGPSDAPRVVFAGVFNYPPNEEGAVWLAREVWPRVLGARPDARLVLVGAFPTRAVRALAKPGVIEVTGEVPDTRPYLWQAAVSAAPLATARGLQNKVLEAIAAGLPCVVTPAVFEGIPVEARPACTVAAAADRFAAAIVALLRAAPAERRAYTALPQLRLLAWEDRLEPLLQVLERASGNLSSGAARGLSAVADREQETDQCRSPIQYL